MLENSRRVQSFGLSLPSALEPCSEDAASLLRVETELKPGCVLQSYLAISIVHVVVILTITQDRCAGLSACAP